MIRWLIICALVLWPGIALAQDSDENYLTRLLQDNLSGDGRVVDIQGFSGALSSEATIDRMTIADTDGIWIELEGLVLAWNRRALLQGEIDVDRLQAASINVIRTPTPTGGPPSAQAEPFSLPELPVSIDLRTLQIDALTLGAAVIGEPVTLEINGAASLGDGAGTADFQALRTDGPLGQFRVSGSFDNTTRILDLSLQFEEGAEGLLATRLNIPDRPALSLAIDGTGPIGDFAANLTLATNTQTRLSGQFRQSLQDDTQVTTLSLGGDIRPLVQPDYRSFLGPDSALSARIIQGPDGRTAIPDLSLKTAQFDLGGALSFDAGGWPEFLRLDGTIGSATGAPVVLPFEGGNTTVQSGQISLRHDPTLSEVWQIETTLSSLATEGATIDELFLTGGGVIQPALDAITVDLQYGTRGMQFDDTASADVVGDALNGSFRAMTADTGFIIEDFTLNGAGLTAEIAATIAGSEAGFETQATINAEVAGLSRFSTLAGRPLDGAAAVTANISAQPMQPAFDVRLTATTDDLTVGIDQVDALLAGRGTLQTRASRDAQGTRVEAFSIRTAQGDFTGSAAATNQQSNAAITARISDLATLIPQMPGPATLSAEVSRQATGATDLQVSLDGPDISLAGKAQSTDNAPEIFETSIDASVQGLSRLANLIGQPLGGDVSVAATATLSQDLQMIDGQAAIETRAFSIGNPTVDPLLAGSGTITAAGGLNGEQITIRTLEASTRELTLVAALNGTSSQGEGRFNASLRDIGVLTDQLSGPVRASGTASLGDAGRWGIDISGTGPGGLEAQVNGQITPGGTVDVRVNGAAPLALANAALAPRRLSGLAQFDLALDGPPEISALSGTVQITDARLAAPTLGEALTDLNGRVTIANTVADLDFAAGVSSGGDVRLSGPLGLSAPNRADLSLTLRNVTVQDPDLYSTRLTGDITVTGPLSGGAVIQGDIDLAKTDVQVPSSSVSSLGTLPDVVHDNAPARVRQTLSRAGLTTTGQQQADTTGNGPAFPLDITINAPGQIFVRGRGLDAELGGSLSIGGTTQAVVPTGRFSLIRGRLDILQQRFELSEGVADLQGSFDPFLRLVANTTADTGTAIRIIVEGPAAEPQVSFQSSPELPQDEVLAQLIFGRDISSLSAIQAIQLAAAINTLAGNGGDTFGGLRDTLGVDDLDLTTDEEGNAAVRAGAYVSDNIYTDVTVTSEGDTEVNLNLDITSEITAKGSVDQDGETSLGVFFERDY